MERRPAKNSKWGVLGGDLGDLNACREERGGLGLLERIASGRDKTRYKRTTLANPHAGNAVGRSDLDDNLHGLWDPETARDGVETQIDANPSVSKES